MSQLKKRYGKDPLDVESLVPALPLPDPQRAADALSAITECFQAIADSQAAKEAAAAKASKPSMFSFRSATSATSTATPAAAPATNKSAESVPVGSGKSGLISALAAETSSAKHAASEALPSDSSLETQVLVPGETVAAGQREPGQTAQGEELVAKWDERQRQLSSDQMPVTLAEGFKYW